MQLLHSPEDTELANEAGWYEKEGYIVRNVWRGVKRTSQRFHVEVMCQVLGVDRIEKGYVVHHKNEDTKDNRRENLELMPLGEHISHHHKGTEKPYVAERNRSQKMRDALKGNKHGEKLAGDANGRSVVTDKEWLWGIEELYKGTFKNQAELARHFGLQKTQVTYVLQGKSRKYLQAQILAIKHRYGRE